MSFLWKSRDADIFHHPVDVKKFGIPHYYDIIKKPMDFTTIKKKLNHNIYEHPQQFLDDVNLVFQNCILFNGDQSNFGIISQRI